MSPAQMKLAVTLGIAAGLVAAGAAVGWTLNGWRMSGQIRELEGTVATQKQAIATLDAANQRCSAGLADVRGAVQGFIADANGRQAAAAEAIERVAGAAEAHLQAAQGALARVRPAKGRECDQAALEAATYARKRRGGQ
jgi:hypothetical protein